jgi:DNA-binding NarL/FixJ family response regulator
MKTSPASPKSKYAVLIVDDHPLLRDGLGKVLNQQVDFRVCGEAGDARGALAAIPKCRPDVVIVDLTMEDGNGLDLIKDIRAQHAALPVLVLSMHHENLYAERAIRAGAQGYVMKREPVGTVVDSLRKVLHGHIALSENMVSRMIVSPGAGANSPDGSPASLLSDRELDVFRLLGHGLGTRQIAAKLRIAASTVETHRAAIKRKLGLAAATELVARAAQFVLDQKDA